LIKLPYHLLGKVDVGVPGQIRIIHIIQFDLAAVMMVGGFGV